jgi:hypothetical protein
MAFGRAGKRVDPVFSYPFIRCLSVALYPIVQREAWTGKVVGSTSTPSLLLASSADPCHQGGGNAIQTVVEKVDRHTGAESQSLWYNVP